MTHTPETAADEFFRADAAKEGWLDTDPHEPGNGRGLWAYYRSAGMDPPGHEEKYAPGGQRSREITGLELDFMGAADLTGASLGQLRHQSSRNLEGVQ